MTIARKKRPRNWDAATAKLEAEDFRCRNCGSGFRVERAHVIGREHDYAFPVRNEDWQPGDVHPDRIIPLCHDCHQGPNGQHARRLEVIPLLTLPEQVQAVADAGGIYPALYALSPAHNPRRVA